MVELLAVEKWLACISVSGVCLKLFCCVTPNYPHRIFRGNEHQMRNHLCLLYTSKTHIRYKMNTKPENYFILRNDFILDKNLTPKEKDFLLKFMAICTNTHIT